MTHRPLGVTWMADAVCASLPADVFFPEHEYSYQAFRAKSACASCPVQRDCLRYALDQDVVGIWGGMTTSERKKTKAALRVA